jgi:hypothetical protein
MDTQLENFQDAFKALEDLLVRVNRSIGLLSFSLGCATGIVDNLSGTNMRNLFSKLGTGSTQADKEALVINKSLITVDANKGESNLLTRLSTMRTYMKSASGDDWDADMTMVKTDATDAHDSFMNVTALP